MRVDDGRLDDMDDSQGRVPENHDTIQLFRNISPHSIQYTMLRTSIECIAGPSRLPLRPLIPRSCTQRIRAQIRGLATTTPASSGHNRWSKIRHKKGAVDAQRSAIFSRLTNVRLSSCLSSHLWTVQWSRVGKKEGIS